MSKIGKKKILIPKDVKVSINSDNVDIKGPCGDKKINLDAYFSKNLFDKANTIGKLSSEKRIGQSTNTITIKPNSVTLISYLNE